jgi:hypothetical protein
MDLATDLARVMWSRMSRSDAHAEEDSSDLRVSHGLSIEICKEENAGSDPACGLPRSPHTRGRTMLIEPRLCS